jgi:hypothetical protein
LVESRADAPFPATMVYVGLISGARAATTAAIARARNRRPPRMLAAQLLRVPTNASLFLLKGGRLLTKSLPPALANPQAGTGTLRSVVGVGNPRGRSRAVVMLRSTAVAIAILSACDFVAFGGRYTETVVRILAAIEHSFV